MQKNKNLKNTSYKQAGVDIDEGNALVQKISSIAKQTSRLGSNVELGSFGGIFDLHKLSYKDPLLVSCTDGVGTKLKIAQALNKHDTIGQDLVAMCINDLLVQGAEPLFFLDYFATGKLDSTQAANVIKGIARACKESNCALLGGETAEMPGMYARGEYDLAGFAVGIVERAHVLPKLNMIHDNDIVIGIESSGPHSNGYSLIRKIISDNSISLDTPPPFQSSDQTLGQLLLKPTHIYTHALLSLGKKQKIKALAHITGGGLLENIPRVLPKTVSVELYKDQWHTPEVFSWIQNKGNILEPEMHRTFNMGIGMVCIVSKENSVEVMQEIRQKNYQCYEIGKTILKKQNQPQVIIK